MDEVDGREAPASCIAQGDGGLVGFGGGEEGGDRGEAGASPLVGVGGSEAAGEDNWGGDGGDLCWDFGLKVTI